MNLEVLLNNKKDFTLLLISILTPLIYEGFKDMYDDSIKISKDNNTLIVYQNLLRRIPKWSDNIINKENQRIKNETNTEDILDNLIKAVFKSNILLQNSGSDIDNNFYNNISTNNFIHKCYINCGRELYNYPYLFYSKNVPIIKLKKNQKDCISLIENNIENTIRKMLPMNIILDNFLNNNFQNLNNNIVSKQSIHESEKQSPLHSIQESIKKSINESVKKSPLHSIHESIKQSIHESEKQSQLHSIHGSVRKSIQKTEKDKILNSEDKKNDSSFKVKNNESNTSNLFKTNISNVINDSKTSYFENTNINEQNFSESSVYPDDNYYMDYYSNITKKRT